MAWFNSKVKVTFIDDATCKTFGVTEIQPTDLPESFEIDTTLHLGNEDWSVVDAQPKTRAEYAKSKTLTLRLRRIEMMDPGEILYSLPSICDAIPGLSNQLLSGKEFVLAEDDWRQFELVSDDLSSEVVDEIEKIRLIHELSAEEFGWRAIHVRSKPELPLTCDFSLADLIESLNISSPSIGVTYRGAPSPIADGFAFRNHGMTIYGVAPHHKVQAIAFDQHADRSPDADFVANLRLLAIRYNLNVIDWCRCLIIRPGDPQFETAFTVEP